MLCVSYIYKLIDTAPRQCDVVCSKPMENCRNRPRKALLIKKANEGAYSYHFYQKIIKLNGL